MNLVELLLEEKRLIDDAAEFNSNAMNVNDPNDKLNYNALHIANVKRFLFDYFIENMMDQETKILNQDKLRIPVYSPKQLLEMHKDDQLEFNHLAYDFARKKTGFLMIGKQIYACEIPILGPYKEVRCPEKMTVEEFAKLYIEELNKTLSLALGENVSQEQIAEEISKACTEAFCKINNIQSQTL